MLFSLAIFLLSLLPLMESFRYMPEHVFTLDVSLICQPKDVRLPLNAVVQVWEADTITRDDFIGKTAVDNGRSFQFVFRHEEFGEVSPYMILFHDCFPGVIQDRCYARTEFHFAEPEQLGSTLYLNVDLLAQKTDLICEHGYPFKRVPPQLQDAANLPDDQEERPLVVQPTPADFPLDEKNAIMKR
ncbi:hypothetical protein M3Y99_00423600 [Aphelenchoides fujianensis]|nr:hypothetical protein M3Y99_00423600 [Aphelenchoides fujianensis]